MNRFEALREGEIGPPTDPRWDLVSRVAESACFQKSPRLREILLYVSQKTLENRPEEVREQRIGHHVFGRRADYNPSEDNIVRVEARNLRKRLEEYFANEGRDENIIITIPKGSYVPRFEPREVAVVDTVAGPESESEVPQVEIAVPAPPLVKLAQPVSDITAVTPRGVTTWLPWILAVVCVLLTFALWWTYRSMRNPRNPVVTAASRSPIWASLFNDDQTLVICADSAWVLRQDLLGQQLSLNDYLSSNWTRAYTEEDVTDPALRVLRTKQYTSMADVRVVERMLLRNANSWSHTAIRSSRNAQARDFKTGNVIMIGSVRAIPWEDLFRDQLNFWADWDPTTHLPIIRNRHPLGNEPATYRNAGAGTQFGNAYSAIAYVPNLSHTGNILIIAGSSMEGCEAAGEYLTDPKLLNSLLRRFGKDPSKPPPYFEVVLNSGTLAGASQGTEVVAYRVWKSKE